VRLVSRRNAPAGKYLQLRAARLNVLAFIWVDAWHFVKRK